MNKFSIYSKPTAELLLKMLRQAYKTQSKIDKILEQVSDEVLQELIELYEELEHDGYINLDQEIKLRDYPHIYEKIIELENKEWDRLMEQAWIMMNVLMEESLVSTYKNTLTITYNIFGYSSINNKYQVLKVQKPEVIITDTNYIRSQIKIPWCQDGKTYSDRLYGKVAQFRQKLDYVLTEGITKGRGMEWMTQAWRKLTGSTAYDTARLLKTETVAMWSKATKEAYTEMGIEYVEIIGDAECGGICTDYVGEAIPLATAELGDELPPYHPNCACSYIAYEDVGQN